MREVYRAKLDSGHTQVQYQLEAEDYDWLLYNLAPLLEEVKDTGAVVSVLGKVLVDTDSDAESTPPEQPVAGVVHKKGVTLGYDTVEYHFTVRIQVPSLDAAPENPEDE